MTFRIVIDPIAQEQIDQLAVYLRGYSEDFATEQIARLDRILHFNLRESPLTWTFFPLTGAPYRGYLFRVGRRTQYWIVYTVDIERRIVNVLLFWNASGDPKSIDL